MVAARARSEDVTFPGGTGTMSGAYAAAESPRGAVLVVHENRGLTDHIRAVAGRLAGDGYSALAPDLLSRAGGTAGAPDATAALGAISTADLVTDLRSGLTELARRADGLKLGVMGFCFGGGMTWQLLDSGPSEVAAAVPFYGPSPDAPTFTGAQTAVLGVFAEKDARVNAGRDKLEAALTAAGVTHELVTVPGVDHAFFNDTGARYDQAAASAGLPAGAELVRHPSDLIGRKRFHPLSGARGPRSPLRVTPHTLTLGYRTGTRLGGARR